MRCPLAQAPWIRNQLLSLEQQDRSWRLLAWLGLCATWKPSGPAEPCLRWQCLLLAAARLCRVAQCWWARLPPELRRVEHGGQLCRLFWPPPHSQAAVTIIVHSFGWWMERVSKLQSFTVSMIQHLAESSGWVMTVIDREIGSSLGSAEQPAPPSKDGVGPSGGGGQTPESGISDGVMVPQSKEFDSSSAQPAHERDADFNGPSGTKATAWQLEVLFAVQHFAEQLWAVWGADLAMLSMLLAAFAAGNALSLLLAALVCLCMASRGRHQSWLWSHWVVPVLGCVLLLQYALLLGFPSPIDPPLTTFVPAAQNLGAGTLDFPAARLLAADPSGGLGLSDRINSHLRHDHPAGGWPSGTVDSEPSLLSSLSDVNAAGGSATKHPKSEALLLLQRWCALVDIQTASLWALCLSLLCCMQQAFASTHLGDIPADTVAGRSPGPAPQSQAAFQSSVFHPLLYSEQASWSWLDWLRYEVIKYSRDLLLVCVALVCFVEKDILHAGYLALVLVFFRMRRGFLGTDRQLLVWLPAFNMAVIVLQLMYQVGSTHEA